MQHEIYRIEALTFKNGWDLLKITYDFDEALRYAALWDKYYLRIMQCGAPRKNVFQNYDRIEQM